MPGGDGTGPNGMGPMTGRATGYCAGGSAQGRGFWGPGRGVWGCGSGFRGGRARGGFRRGAYGALAPYSADSTRQRLDMLKSQAGDFSSALEDIQQRIRELETGERTE